MDTRKKQEILLERFEMALLSLDRLAAQEILSQVSSLRGPLEAVETLVIPCLETMGARFENGELSLSQIYMAGRISDEAVDRIMPATGGKRDEKAGQPRIAVAVLEDHHGLGKKIVYLTLRSAGYDLTDYGLGLSGAQIVERVLDDGVEILLISVLMLPSAIKVREIRDALDKTERGREVKLLVGGAPFRYDSNLWLEVGADAVAGNASETIEAVAGLINGKKAS